MTRKSDNATVPVDVLEIDFFRPALHECEIVLKNGPAFWVKEDEDKLRKLIKNALDATN